MRRDVLLITSTTVYDYKEEWRLYPRLNKRLDQAHAAESTIQSGCAEHKAREEAYDIIHTIHIGGTID